MAKWVKCLQPRMRTAFGPQHHMNAKWRPSCNASVEQKIPIASWLATLTRWFKSGSSERPCLRHFSSRASEKTPDSSLWLLHTSTCMHTHTCTHVYLHMDSTPPMHAHPHMCVSIPHATPPLVFTLLFVLLLCV